MKHFKFIYILLLLVAVFITSCSNDEPTGENSTARKDGKVCVRLRLSQASSTVTMRAEDTPDANAESKELMNIWTVVITQKSGEVVDILTCVPTDEDREIDVIEETVKLTPGEYEFYSFANIDALHLAKLLGFAKANATSQSVIPEPPDEGEIAHAETESITTLNFPDGKTLDNYTANVNGNDFNAFDSRKKDNGFGYYGIPMSNKQTITIEEDTKVVDLIVVRMLAKIKLQITNDGADAVTIESVTLTDITKYGADSPNLKLFPKYTTEIPNGSDLMADYEHGDIQPNLNGTPDTEEVTIEVKDENGNFVSVASREMKEITFYVNESQTPNTSQNLYKHFYLKLNLAKSSTVGGDAETTTKVTEQRYALIDDNGTKEGEKWDYIARNDYRIIPISLDDYKFELIPYDFPAIGVYPASVKEEDGLNTITFHDYGHFHLLPKVTKFTTSGAESVSFGTGSGTWGLKEGTFSSAWESWDDHTKEASDTNVALFYGGADGVANEDGSAKINDGDDAGGFPVWYANDNKKSQWSPDGTNYPPFIFGYIADPEEKLDEDRKVYHEFTIVINKDGSAPREMTYRLYMILDTEQMMYGRSRKFVAPSAHHKMLN